MELLCDSHHGVYIPQLMARRLFDAGWQGIEESDVIELECDIYENEFYWDTWERILNNAQYIDDEGETWFLWQDGDLWAVTQRDFDKMGEL